MTPSDESTKYNVGGHGSTPVDEGEKVLNPSRDKKCEARAVVGRGESLLFAPGSE